MVAGRQVIERSRRREQRQDAVGGMRVHAEFPGRGENLEPVPAAVEQVQERAGAAHPGQGNSTARVDPDLHGVTVTPNRQQSRFQCWPHECNAGPPV
jgi:hypothetical protein